MTRYAMREARRNLTDIVSRVAYGGERITIGRRGRDMAVLVSTADAEILGEIEDAEDVRDALNILARMRRRGERPVPWEQVKRRLAARRSSSRKR